MRVSFFAALVGCSLWSTGALAQAPLDRVDNGWRLSAGSLRQDYQETNSGLNPSLTAPIVDAERGFMPTIAFDWRQSSVVYTDVSLTYAGGSDSYTGYACGLQSPYACNPDQTTTDNTFLSGDIRLGPQWDFGGLRMVPFLNLGVWSWDRRIASTPAAFGPAEHYRFGYYGVGGLIQTALTPAVVWSIDGAWGRTLQPVMVNDGLQFDLGEAAFWQAGTGLDIEILGPWHLTADARWVRFGFGASPVYDTGSYFVQEPDSRTQQFSYRLGVGRDF